jgi:uncharacterized DUF497 family protein
MKYEWDDGKRRENLRKHGLDFEDASEIFKGPRLVRLDIRIDYGEDRWVAIGIAKNRVVVVAYTEDDAKQLIRIISLRKALGYEKKRFEEYLAY